MEIITYSDARNHLSEVINSVVENQDTALIKRTGDKENVIIMSENQYDSLMESVYLLDNSENKEKLLASIIEDQIEKKSI